MNRPRTLWTAAGALLFMAAAATAALTLRQRPERAAWKTMQREFSGERPFEPLVADVPYARWTPTRGSVAPRDRDTDLRLAAAVLEKHALSSPTAAAFDRAAVARLALDDVDGAIALFDRAAALPNAPPALQCDRAAAFLVRSRRTGDGLDIARAIDASSRAADADASGSCRFNLALALERTSLDESAAAAWRDAAGVARPWSDEARVHAAALARVETRASLTAWLEPLVAGTADPAPALDGGNTDVVGELLERRVLVRWAEDVGRGDREAATATARRATLLADRLLDRTGDRYFAALVRELTACGSRCAEGWRHHVRALDAWDDERFAAVREMTHAADEAFGTGLSAVNAARTLVRVTIARLDGRGAEAADWLRAADAYATGHGYRMIAGRLAWQQALLSSEAGEFGRAMALYRTAIGRLTEAGDREGVAVAESLLAGKYQQLENPEAAWRHEMAALAGLRVSRPLRHRSILALASFLSQGAGLDAAAMAFHAPLVDAARRSGAAINLARFLADDATTYQRLGRRDLAHARIDEANAHVGAIEDAGAASMIRALVRVAEGKLLADERPADAAGRLQEAIDIYTSRGNTFATPAIQLDRGRALLKAGQTDAAERAFGDGIAAADRERRTVASDADRVAALAARWDLFAQLIDLRIARHDDRGALELLDRARAINLIERLESRGQTGTVPLPAGTVVIEYVALPSGLFGWISDGDRRDRFRAGLPLEAVRDAATAYGAAIQARNRERTDAAGRRLSSALLSPIADRLQHATRVVVVPDDVLSSVPFASLPDPAGGRPLIERLAVVMAPSLAFYRTVSPRASTSAAIDALVVGDPDRDGAIGDALPRLPASAREARAVAGFYQHAMVATGANATRDRFLTYARQAGVIHFAGHALVSEQQGEYSRLLLAPAPDDPVGAVFALDIQAQVLPATRLVVLSACETAQGRRARGEGVNGLVRAFLVAGAPTVVATLWPIDDAPAADLFNRFHAIWTRGVPADEALRQAQLETIRAGRGDARDWAGAVVVSRVSTTVE